MPEYSLLEKIIIWAIPVLFAITVHEVAHGWVADKLGDQTAKMMGRITLNPIKHIDPIGTVALPLILLFIGSFIFGWAKPVPVTWKNLRNPRRDMALVAFAGPAANLIMMIIWGILAKLVILISAVASISQFLLSMCGAGILINIVLMVLNLFPLLPLDGGRVLSAMLPVSWAEKYSRLEPYGFFILIALLATGVLGKIIWPIIEYTQTLIFGFI